MLTSNFRISGNDPNAVGISLGVPGFFKGLRYPPLHPTRAMLRLSRSDFETAYSALLSTLDAAVVWRELHELAGPSPILLCWESPNQYCHRRLVSTWLELSLGVSITEAGLDRDACLPPSLAPEKPPSCRWAKRPPLPIQPISPTRVRRAQRSQAP
jgi:hypothetical protein